MRIVHIISSLDARSGGPPIVVTRLAAAQAGLPDTEVHILAYPSDHDLDLSDTPHSGKLKIHHAPQCGPLEKVTGKAAADTLDTLIRDHGVQLVQLHGMWEGLIRACAARARKRGLPTVLTPHGMLDPWALTQSRLKKRVALALGYQRMIHAAGAMHAISRFEADCIKRYGYKGRVEVVPNGVQPEEIEPIPQPGRFRAAHPELAEDPYILFLSRLHPVKGLDILGEAFERVAKEDSNVRLVVAGPDYGSEAGFRQQIRGAGLDSRVHVVGPLWGPAKFEAMRDAACFCLPSEHESFGLVIAEAMAVQTPVVVSMGCNFPEVGEAGAGTITRREPRPIAEAILEILRDPSLASEMGRRGRRLVLDRFTWPRAAEQSLALYRDLRTTAQTPESVSA